MLNRFKSAAVAAACALAMWSCNGSAPQPQPKQAAPAPTTRTTVIFGGGYVFAFGAGKKTVDVGAMHVASGSAGHTHPMVLAIGKGDWDKKETTIPIQTTAETTEVSMWEGWDLTNYEVLIKPGGADPQEPGLTVPASTTPADPCAVPTDPNNWFYIPEMTKLAAGTQPSPTLKDVMMTRIPLSRGALAVNALAPGCFSFADTSGVKSRQLTAHGREGVTWTTNSPGAFVDLILNDVKTGKPAGKIRLLPDGNREVAVTINTHLKKEITPKDPKAMAFFDMYYDLVTDVQGMAVASKARLMPTWEGASTPVMVTPGGECPPVSVGYQ